jgi:hypothetical protein
LRNCLWERRSVEIANLCAGKIAGGAFVGRCGRLFADLDVTRPTDVRDRAILMLFATYGLRAIEV